MKEQDERWWSLLISIDFMTGRDYKLSEIKRLTDYQLGMIHTYSYLISCIKDEHITLEDEDDLYTFIMDETRYIVENKCPHKQYLAIN